MPSRGELAIEFDQVKLRELEAALRDAGSGGLRRRLNKELRESGVEIRNAEQSAARALPANGPVSTGLRQSIADATTIRVISGGANAGVRVYVKKSQTRGHLSSQTARPRGWRHPVFGNRNVWVTQVMSPYWWQKTYAKYLPAAREKIRQTIDEMLVHIARR